MFNVDRSSKNEQIRAWAIERALEMENAYTVDGLVNRAAAIEDFVLNGKKES